MSGAPDPVPVEVKPEPTLIEQTGGIPETVTPETAIEPVEPEPEPEAKVEAAEEPKPKTQKPWFVEQIAREKGRAAEAERRAAQAEAEAKVLKAAQADPNAPALTGLTREQYDRDVQAEAQRQVQQQTFRAKSEVWLANGVKEYGAEEFNQRCDMLAAMGASDKPDFMQVILDPDLIPEGHKIVASLAEKPEEARRILSLETPVQRAAALVKYSMTVPAEKKQVSNAPKPISPIGGTAKASAPSESDDTATWMAKRRAEVAARKQRA